MSQNARRPRRGPSSNGSSLNSTMSIVVAAVAVLLGFLILRDIGGSNSASSDIPVDPAMSETIVTETTVVDPAVTESTLPLTGFKVQIANASEVSGSAGELTTQLQGRGFIVQPAINASDATQKQIATVVFFNPGSEGAAALVAATLGGVATAPMPTPIPTETGNIGEASVLIFLGTDLAGKPLPAG
ncbi:hypothetical protein LBMAG07_07280 [Actinomycetes bacterium]|nr:hypothetical protein LBMAG07_07280 [Actinomycetes bacterium]